MWLDSINQFPFRLLIIRISKFQYMLKVCVPRPNLFTLLKSFVRIVWIANSAHLSHHVIRTRRILLGSFS